MSELHAALGIESFRYAADECQSEEQYRGTLQIEPLRPTGHCISKDTVRVAGRHSRTLPFWYKMKISESTETHWALFYRAKESIPGSIIIHLFIAPRHIGSDGANIAMSNYQ